MSTSLWTNIDPAFSSTPAPSEGIHPQRDENLPAMTLGITYILLVPLAIFAVHGGFSFEHASWNSDIGAVGGKFAVVPTSADTLLERIQSGVALVVSLLAMLPFYRRIASACLAMPLMLVLPIYATMSSLWSQDAGLSLRGGVSLLVSTLFAFYFVIAFSQRQQMEIVLLTGFCIVAASIVIALFWPRFGLDHQLHEGAWQGLFTQKNVCAGVTLFLLTPALALPSRHRYGQAIRALYIALCLLVILMTQSRTGWAITLIYLAFTSGLRVLGKFERKDMLPLVVLIFAAFAILVMGALQYPSIFLSMISRSDSISGRSEIWTAIVASILRHPIGGYGFDAFWSLLHGEASNIFASTGWVVTGAHNGFLNVGLELGLVGIALVLATFVLAFRHACQTFHTRRSSYVDWCIGIVFLTFIYNLDERTLMAPQYLLWIL
jgi:exopolysaccharide production protein ExoQ